MVRKYMVLHDDILSCHVREDFFKVCLFFLLLPATPKTAREEVAMDPLGPFGVELPIGFLVLRFEHSHNLAVEVAAKV